MGEIADMMINGLLDSQTGEYIDGKSPGFPRTLNKTKKRSNKNNGNGVKNYLRTRHKWLLRKKKHSFCLKYLEEIGKFNPKTDQTPSWQEIDEIIQPKFEQFRDYAIKERFKHYKKN